MPSRARRLAMALAASSALVATSQAAWATFSDGASSSATYTAGVLIAPSAPTATAGTCSTISGDRTVVRWTATTSTWATGYEIARSTTAGGPYTVVGTASGAATTSYTDSGLAFSTTYHYAIRSMRNAWRSGNATTLRTTKGSLCL